jgi:transposase
MRSLIVWGDEMGTSQNEAVHRRRGRSTRGARAVNRAPTLDRSHFSCLAFTSWLGVLCHMTVPGAVTSAIFLHFAYQQLVPLMQAGGFQYLVLDNCSIHKNAELKDFLERSGLILLFLPAYSPWLNPIEQVFRSVKMRLRRNAQFYIDQGHDIYTLLVLALNQISHGTCQSLITEAGYH